MKNITLESKGYIRILTINRPEALNALNTETLSELEWCLMEVDRDENARVLIITGAGKAFVAGADIAEMRDMSSHEAFKFGAMGNSVFSRVEDVRIPVIAAVNGFALGGGCELALACDIRYASERAKFGQPEVSLGITPGFGGTQRLARAVGTAKAMEIILTGKMLSAQQAKEINLVNEVFAPETLMNEVMATATAIAANAPVAVRASKAAIQRFALRNMESDLEFETKKFGTCFDTKDQKTGMTAFLEKRPREEFTGK